MDTNSYWLSDVGYWELVTTQSDWLTTFTSVYSEIPCHEVLKERQITYRLDIIFSRPLAITGNTQTVGYTIAQGGCVGMSACTEKEYVSNIYV
jgi:hypothetical protein